MVIHSSIAFLLAYRTVVLAIECSPPSCICLKKTFLLSGVSPLRTVWQTCKGFALRHKQDPKTYRNLKEYTAQGPYVRRRVPLLLGQDFWCRKLWSERLRSPSGCVWLSVAPIKRRPKICNVKTVIFDQDVSWLDVLVSDLLFMQILNRGTQTSEKAPEIGEIFLQERRSGQIES